MTHKNRFNLLMVFLLILITGAPIISPIQAQEPFPQGAILSMQAALGTEFTYQGRLTNNTTGDPIACGMRLAGGRRSAPPRPGRT